MKLTPPKKSLAFLRWFCREDYLEEIEGDLFEVFEKQSGMSQRKAKRQFTWSVIKYFRPRFIKSFREFNPLISFSILFSFLKTGWRNLLRNKAYSTINIGGLSAGIAAFMIIILFIEHEFSYDRWHKNPDQIVRIVKDFVNQDGAVIPDATTAPAMAAAIRRELPGASAVTRFMPPWGRKFLMEYSGKKFHETNLIRVDSNFFKVFDFPFIKGSSSAPFQNLHSVLLTETAAKKYFGNTDPINQTLNININNGTDYIVSGVLKDAPGNSHFDFDFLIPFESNRNPDSNWNSYTFYTYARLNSNTDPKVFETQVQSLFKKHQPESRNRHYLQSLADIHLKSKLKWELGTNGDLSYVRILAGIAILVLLIAGINYINLVIAQSTGRAKEIGVRKVAGARRHFLVKQFLVESILTVFIATIISLLLIWLITPFTKSVFNIDTTALLKSSKIFWYLIPATILVFGLLAGCYPAFRLSSIEVLSVLKGNFRNSISGIKLRHALVIFQVAVSVILIISLLVTREQLDFIRNKNLGFQSENILLLNNIRGAGDPAPMLNDISALPGISGMGLVKPIAGQQLIWEDAQGKNHMVEIVGIVKDFHFTSFHESIKPFGFIHEENNGSTFFVRLTTKNPASQISNIEKIWRKHHQGIPFEYSFHDEQFAKLYLSENRFQKLFSFFTILATIIAFLGLFTLSAYVAASRTKEIGIRKVLGSSVLNMFIHLSREFALLVIIAFFIAIPLAYWGASEWLNGFAYRISIDWKIFASGGIAAILILILATGFNIMRAALMNPVKSLKTE